ncbi:hypothetical protein ACIPW5_33650 [Streptomyces sp. NPDC090077]|uniref:hypothetical protein n=1 Tax=Streptomyces sp. NPDC090077 TaxID=3365938 RepID=UPI0037FF22DE
MSQITATVYSLASKSLEDIEPLRQITQRRAEAILDDSRRQWPEVYLIQRADGGPWQPAGS